MTTWARIDGTDHEVSDDGRIRSLKGKERKLGVGASGYVIVRMWRRGDYASISVHRLVAESFIGPCPGGLVVNHRDGCKTNNSASNLEYITRSENLKHAHRMGLAHLPTNRSRGDSHWTRKYPELVKRGKNNGAAMHPERILRGSGCPSSKLTESDVVAIRARAAVGEHPKALGLAFGVSRENIIQIIKRNTWKHIP